MRHFQYIFLISLLTGAGIVLVSCSGSSSTGMVNTALGDPAIRPYPF